MFELNDLQWAFGAAAVITSLVIGGWLNRERIGAGDGSDHHTPNEPTQKRQQLEARDIELNQMRQQLEARDIELKAAREEADLILLQLYQVQEELEHYFLESRNLQKKLDSEQTISPQQTEQLKRINTRLLKLFKTSPLTATESPRSESIDRLEALVRRQQNALRRFKALQHSI